MDINIDTLPIINGIKYFERWIPMADGTRLYVSVMLPANGDKFPTILFRNPYVEDVPTNFEEFVNYNCVKCERGYAFIFQHCRGCGQSEGGWVPYDYERNDGLDTLNWIRTLPWYNGEIFLDGGSYSATVHWSYLDTNPSDVKAASLSVQDVNRYNIAYRNGFFKNKLHGGWFCRGYLKKDKTLYRNEKDTFHDFPLCEFSMRQWGHKVRTMDNVLTHPRPDDPFWQSYDMGSGADCRNGLLKSTMPILLMTGHYDIYTEGVHDMWRETPDERLANCAFLVDGYDHGGNCPSWAKGTRGECPNGERMVGGTPPSRINVVLDWFDHVRLGKEFPYCDLGKTRYYAMWENKWLTDKSLTDGERTVSLKIGNESHTWQYDPLRPAPIFPGSGGICFGGFEAQPEPNFRDDVVSFILPEAEEELDVRGRITADLTVKSDCEDTCFYIRVSINKGDGIWYLLRDDIMSLCWDRKDYTPGEKKTIHFRFADHAFRIEKGDQLRVDISSACDQFAPHPNVKGDAFAVSKPKTANNTIVAEESYLHLYVKK